MNLKHLRIWILFTSLVSANASALEMGITTGGKNGTYIQIASDISRLLKKDGVNLKVYTSKGSLDNIDSVVEKDHIQFGIVQSDVLNFIKDSKDRKIERIANNIKNLFPLYNEEIHILAKKDIKSIQDLHGKVVSIGPSGSGTHLTSHLILKKIGVWPLKKIAFSAENALAALKAGSIDAMFYVSGYPVKLFSNAGIKSDYHLIPITDKDIKKYYVASTIPANTYPWQKTPVNTVAIKAVLMSVGAQSRYCQEAQKMTQAVYDNIDWLKTNGHPKWNDVDLDYDLNQWERYDCVASTFKKINSTRNAVANNVAALKK